MHWHDQSEIARWRAPVARWATWEACADTTASPDVSFIPANQRRRLSLFARMTLRVAHDCAHDLTRVRLVFASRHGDLQRTTAMLNDIAQGEALSPTAFGLSVLNANAGLFSILRNDTSAATAISAARSSFGFGLLEATTQLTADPSIPVLFVYADEPATEFYGNEANSTGSAHAVALLFAANGDQGLECTMAAQDGAFDDADNRVDDKPHSLLLRDSLETLSAGCWHGEGRCWTWHWTKPWAP